MWIKNPAGALINLATADMIAVQQTAPETVGYQPAEPVYALIARHGVYHSDVVARGSQAAMESEMAHIERELFDEQTSQIAKLIELCKPEIEEVDSA